MITTSATIVKKYDSPSGYVSLVIFQPQEVFTFLEGQFVMIEAEIDGKLVKKPYSIATTNKQLQEEKEIGVIVKKTSERGMSDYLTKKVKPGDALKIKGPVGHYVDSHDFTNYLLISVGSGLSPNAGLFKHLVYEERSFNKLVHMFGERHHEHIIPEVESLFLDQQHPDVHNLFYLSQEDQLPPNYQRGYVQEGLSAAIDLLGTHTSCFLCGKPEMVQSVQQELINLGIPKEQITFEKY